MKREEKEFIRNMPEKYRPKGAWALFWYGVLYTIPLIGWIFWLVHAISDANISRRSFARRYFCAFLMGAIVVAIVLVLVLVVFPEMGEMFKEYIMQFVEMIKGMIPSGG